MSDLINPGQQLHNTEFDRNAFFGEDSEPRLDYRFPKITRAISFDLNSRQALDMWDALHECREEGRPCTVITWQRIF